MRRILISLYLILALVAWAKPPTTQPAPATRPSDAFLDPVALHVIHLKLSREAFDQIQPTRTNLFAGIFAATRPVESEPKHESPFGYQYSYVHGALEWGGRTYDNIGLRYKGNSSYLTASGLKKPFKVNINHYDKGQSLAGLTTFNLHNNAMDPTFLREAMSYQVFRDLGVPASRTAWALVYLTVESVHDRKLVGLYTVVEEVNKSFLKDHFGSGDGLLLKPENAFNLPYLGDKFERYEKMYRPKSSYTQEMGQQVVEFLKLIHQADDQTFDQKIETYLDVDAFLRFIAANAILGNMDSFLSTGHNFYMYVHPRTLKIHFIPWDLNLSFGTFDWVGSIRDQADLSLMHPYVQKNRLTERVLKIDRFAKAYRDEIRRMTQTSFVTGRVVGQIKAMEAVIAKAETLANVPHRPLPAKMAPEGDLKVFVARRFESVAGQLAGTREGYAPYWQGGPFGMFNRKPATRPATTRPTTRPQEKH
jgi:spore coat protein H